MPSIFQRLFERESTTSPATQRSVLRSSGEFDAVYAQAIARAPERNPELAIQLFDQAIERRPDYTHANCNRGVVQQALGSEEAALSSYARAIALDPAGFMAPYNRALLMQESSRWEEAIVDYDRAIALNPQTADALYNRSAPIRRTGRHLAVPSLWPALRALGRDEGPSSNFALTPGPGSSR